MVGVHNATEGMGADLPQCVKDKLDKGTNPAVDTLADTVYSEIEGGPLGAPDGAQPGRR